MWGVRDSHFSLEGYWDWLQISECAGYGIRNAPMEVTGSGCPEFWNQDERYWMTGAIAKAEKRVEMPRWLNFPIRRQCYGYDVGQYNWEYPLQLKKRWVRGIGLCVEEYIETADITTQITNNDSPVEFTVTVDFTDENELLLYYVGQTRYRIRPSSVSIVGTTATVQVPRCRLLSPAFFINFRPGLTGYEDADRPDYDDDAVFERSLDVYRGYLDTSDGAYLFWWRMTPCSSCLASPFASCSVPGCGTTSQAACGQVLHQKRGITQFTPAAYDETEGWIRASFAVGRNPNQIRASIMAGRWDRYEEIDEPMQRAIIALAHNNLPIDYCPVCSVVSNYYKRDNEKIEGAPVRLGLGPSTWGVQEASEIIKEYKVASGGMF